MKLTETQKKLLGLALFALIWMPLHETLHYLVCALAGGAGKMVFALPQSSVECTEILHKTALVQYVYLALPYIFDLVIVLIFVSATFVSATLTRKRIIRTSIRAYLQTPPYVATIDAAYNYFTSAIFLTTDFIEIAKLSTPLLYLSSFIVIAIVMGTAVYFIRTDYKLVIKSVKKFIKRSFHRK